MSEQSQAEIAEQKRANLYYALIGFGAGAIVGATMALLFAPASGKETRAAIKEKWGDAAEKAGEVYGGAKDAVSSAYEKTAAAIGRAKDRLSRKKDDEEEEA
jgi:gas vesicle protein